MCAVRIVVDSTTSMPQDKLDQYNITVAPNIMIWDDKEYLDGVEITAEEFYPRLIQSKTMPTTAAVNISTFEEIFTRLTDEGHDVLCILPNRNFSAMGPNAHTAKDNVGRDNVIVYETDILAMQIIWAGIFTARAAEKGATLDECYKLAQTVIEQGAGFGMVDTLEYLERGGRIGKAQRFIGTALNFKPILEVIDREMTGVARMRSRKKAMAFTVQRAIDRVAGRTPVYLAALHTNTPDIAQELLDMAAETLNPVETFVFGYGPNAGCHLGPGALGLTFVAGVDSP